MEDIRQKVDRKFIAEARGIILDTAKHIKSNDKTFNITTLPDHIPKLELAMNDYIDYTKEVEASENAYLTLIEKVVAIEEGEDEEFIEDDEILEELTTLINQQKQLLDSLERDAIDDLNKITRPQEQAENRGPQIMKDPITKLDIRIPVQSNKCKHVFEKETIENYLTTSKKCPQAGCTNKRMSTKELVPFNVQESSPIIIS